MFKDGDNSYMGEAGVTFMIYLLLYNTMVPISLIVSLEIIKMIQGTLM